MSSDALAFGAVVFAKDVPALARFYEAVLGLQRMHSADDHCVLRADSGMELVVHGIPRAIADSFSISSPPERREDCALKLFFPVPSLAAARARARALGGDVLGPEREWQMRGFRACDGHDPEGNVMQLREPVLESPRSP